MKRLLTSLAFTLLLAGWGTAAEPPGDIFAANRALGRGINLGNALEAPREGEWGLKLDETHFRIIAAAGFDHIRVPIKWSAHTTRQAPYTIDAPFFERIDWVLDQAHQNKLRVVLDMHHYEELDKQPDRELPRAVALWQQIAARYQDRGDWLYFELMNEPHEALNESGKWNSVLPQLLRAVRKTNPTRPVIVGPAEWNNAWALSKFPPPDDRHLIVTIHCYSPFEFTHQGAAWAEGSRKWLGRQWTGSPAELRKLREELDLAANWAKEHNRPLYLGEFGAYEKADLPSRVRWTTAVTREAEQRNMSWAYWEFAAGFGAYNRQKGEWREPILKALQP